MEERRRRAVASSGRGVHREDRVQALARGRGHCVVFFGKTLDAFLRPGVQMGAGKVAGEPEQIPGRNLQWASIV